MFRQLSTTRTEGHTIGKEKGRRGGEVEAATCACVRAGGRARARTSVLSLAAEVFQLDPWVWMEVICSMLIDLVWVCLNATLQAAHTPVSLLCWRMPVCVEGGSQAQVFVMSSLGSFWFNCFLLLFHAVLLSNSSGPVTTVLPLSSSVHPLNNLCPFLLLFLTSYIYSLLMGASSSHFLSCFLLHVWNSNVNDWEEGRWTRWKEHAWMATAGPYHSFQSGNGNSPLAMHLTWLPSLSRLLWYDWAWCFRTHTC